jgi:hypothetical protein
MSMKNSNDTIGNRICSAVPQPTAPSRAPKSTSLTQNNGTTHVTDIERDGLDALHLASNMDLMRALGKNILTS